jgi:hypothetical protein
MTATGERLSGEIGAPGCAAPGDGEIKFIRHEIASRLPIGFPSGSMVVIIRTNNLNTFIRGFGETNGDVAPSSNLIAQSQ